MRWDRLAALGWRPETPFADGLAITLAWYRDRAVPAGARS
jgi:nucleoside-diphosphate-sugar epimerase